MSYYILGCSEQRKNLGRVLESCHITWHHSSVKLTADDQGRLGCSELFPPRKTFDATRQPDGSVRVVELVEGTSQQARLVRRGGRTYLESDHRVTNEDTQAVMGQFP